jgi:hypothetical protein
LAVFLASQIYYKRLQYQVQWKGWDPDPTWYDAGLLKTSPTEPQKYRTENPTKAGPPRRLEKWEKAAWVDMFDPPHTENSTPAEPSAEASTRVRTVRGGALLVALK